jgi:hypothetical protein
MVRCVATMLLVKSVATIIMVKVECNQVTGFSWVTMFFVYG